MQAKKENDADDSDEALMQAYVQGRVRSFEQLYARHEVTLFRFVRRMLGRAHQSHADDVFQDCWLRIVSARASFDPNLGASWKTWAFTIAHNLALDRLRKVGREISVDTALEADDTSPSATLEGLQASLGLHDASAEDIAHWRAAGAQLVSCLDHLPELQRSAFLLHYEENLAVEAIAQSLALGFETVKSRLRYALNKLRTCMQAYIQWEASP